MEHSATDIAVDNKGADSFNEEGKIGSFPYFAIEEVASVIRYFGIFYYPLTIDEVYNLSGNCHTPAELKNILETAKKNYDISQKGEFYYWGEDSSCIEKRLKGEQAALKVLPRAFRVGRFISRFPFVEFVGISGSLSKGYASEKSDFDYFIITSNNTLWICRTLLHLFKKVTFLFRLQNWFCMNYFIDHHHLEIEEKNMFTRIELMTLVPVSNSNLYKYLILKNNIPNLNKLNLDVPKDSFVKAYEHVYMTEKNKWLKPLNLFLMRLTDCKWKQKWARMNFPPDEYPLCFKTTPFVSKNHPKNYQKRILEILHQH